MRVHAFLVKMAVSVVSVFLLWATAGAAGFPERPIQVLCGWPVGSLQDTVDRAIATPLSKILKQPVLVQNIPGGGGALILGRVRSDKPDGYTLYQTSLNMWSQIPWTRSVPFDPLKDFAYLIQTVRLEHYLYSRADSPWKTFEELIQYVRKNPKTVRYSTSGVGTAMHIAMEYLALKENLQWIHVPYNSVPEVTTALLGGHIELGALTLGPELEYVKTGRVRPLLCFNDKRLADLPDLPTVLEKGYDFTCKSSYVWAVHANTPKDIQKILEKALLQASADTSVREVIKNFNKIYDPLGSEALTKLMIEDHQKYGELMKKLGLGIFKK